MASGVEELLDMLFEMVDEAKNTDVSKMVTSLCFSENFFECRSLNHRRR